MRERHEALGLAARQIPVRRRRNRVTAELLREVAKVYMAALADGAPTKAVSEHFHTSHSNAARWVQLARSEEYGFLPKTTPGSTGPKGDPR